MPAKSGRLLKEILKNGLLERIRIEQLLHQTACNSGAQLLDDRDRGMQMLQKHHSM
jgi:hypothetical protein